MSEEMALEGMQENGMEGKMWKTLQTFRGIKVDCVYVGRFSSQFTSARGRHVTSSVSGSSDVMKTSDLMWRQHTHTLGCELS